jgi:hypothetical protein
VGKLVLRRSFSLSPVTKFGVLETATDASQVFEKQKIRDGHQGAVSRSPADHHHILIIGDSVGRARKLRSFLIWLVERYGLLLQYY